MRVASWLWLVPGSVALVPLVGLASIPLWAPTLAAAACARCYRMQRIAEDLRELQTSISAAEATIVAFFGAFIAPPHHSGVR